MFRSRRRIVNQSVKPPNSRTASSYSTRIADPEAHRGAGGPEYGQHRGPAGVPVLIVAVNQLPASHRHLP
ncbi:hypothetical protein [Kitasatospora albolonga]|uniref:hypothetical protein n=1 Tax=Kitasatospora albolonga TaxID=68173 RepID=UPI0031E908B3